MNGTAPPHSQPTVAGELITETLYPYWKDDPKAAIKVTRESTTVIFCGKRKREEVLLEGAISAGLGYTVNAACTK